MNKPKDMSDSDWATVQAVLATKAICLLLSAAFAIYGLIEAIQGNPGALVIGLLFAYLFASYTPLLPEELAVKMSEES